MNTAIGDQTRVRVLLVSPIGRLLLIKYRNTGPDGVDHPCWTTAGGGQEPGETIEETAAREVAEETGFPDVRLGPVVWFGEDGHRGRSWGVVHKEHFIVAFAPAETIDRSCWTDHERNQILDVRWWTTAEIRRSEEVIYPFGLAALLEPILAGDYPPDPIILPPI